MAIYETVKNYFNSVMGVKQEFQQLLDAGDISAVQRKMTLHKEDAERALKEYRTGEHRINFRPDKEIKNRKKEHVRMEKVWKLPIPYPVFINEIALVFMYGRPVKWVQKSEGTDDAFSVFNDILSRTHFDSKLRECKRIAGSETESAMLFRVFRDGDNKPNVQIRVLAASKGDEIYTKWDQYENLTCFAWGYYTRDKDDKSVYHFDIFTKDMIYHCSQAKVGWDIVKEQNHIGKIPVLYFRQDKEWAGVENLIEREEFLASTTADTNDYFSDPALVANSDIIKNLPDKGEKGKVFVTNGQGGVGSAINYLTWDNAPESKRQEREWLQKYILMMSFTPEISLDTLKSVSQLSAKALRTVMMLAVIKANMRKESHDDLLDRASSVFRAIIGNVLDVSKKSQMEALMVGYEYQEPMGDDVTDAINNIVRAVDGGILSSEGGIELNPLVKDPVREKERLAEEKKSAAEEAMSVFGNVGSDNEPATVN